MKKIIDLRDLLLIAGTGSMFFGTFQIYPPAAYILIGAGAIYAAVGRQ